MVRCRKGREAPQLHRTGGKEASVWALGVDPAYRVHASGQAKAADQEGGCAAVEIAMNEVLAGVQREAQQQPVELGTESMQWPT